MGMQAIGHLQIPSPRFVGREAELLWLQERLEEARRSHGTLVFLAGEAGVGKSRLVRELTIRAREREISVLEGRCSLFDAALPYAPLREALRGIIHARGLEETARLLGPHLLEMTKLLPELARVVTVPEPSPSLGPAEERSRLLESLYLALRRMAADAPLILVLDDAHWADPATLGFLHLLARRLPRDRWLVMATYRPEELDRAPDLQHLRRELLRERLAEDLVLAPLGLDDTQVMVDAVLGTLAPAPRGFAEWVYSFGDGNPFFTEEILRTAVEGRGTPLLSLDVQAIGTVPVPSTVRETILARISRLDESPRSVLAAAAVLGRTFSLDSLQHVTALAGEAFTRAVMPLLALHLVKADHTPLQYGFRHHLIREVTLDSLAPDERRRLHQRAGEYHERMGAPVSLLVHCFREAGDRERTARYALAAARDAGRLYAYEEAARYYAAALEAIPDADVAGRLEAAEGWGDALFHAGRLHDAVPAYERMAALAEAAQEQRAMVRAWRKLGRTRNELRPDSGRAFWEKALLLLKEIDDPVEEAMILEQASKIAFLTGNFERGVGEAEAALAAAVRAGDKGAQSRAYKSLSLNLMALGRTAQVGEYLQVALDLAVEAGDLEAELKALNDLGYFAMHEGRLEQARTALERGSLLVEKAGMLPTLLLPMGSLAELSLYDGHWDEAERLLRTTTSLLRERHGRAWPFASDAAFLALVRWYKGDREEAAALLDEARQVAEARADAGSLTLLEMVLARMALAAGDPGQAQGILEGVLGRQGVEASHLADARLLLVEVCVASGQAERARAELEAVERQGYLPLLSARVERMRGRIASLRGDLDAAIEAYRSGTNILQRVRQPYEEAQMQRDLGRTLVRRGGRGDRREARSLLAAAAAGFEALGAGPDAALARQVMGRISGRRPSGGDLTEREREVLALLADGLSNAAIAARLYISERTVEVHVTHILAKIGTESRVQAAAWAAKHHHPSRPSAT